MTDGDTAPAARPDPPRPEGLVLAPFRALRYHRDAVVAQEPALAGAGPSWLARLTSPPYDVLDDDAVSELERTAEHNVVRLILPRDDEGPGSRYPRAARTLGAWRRTGVLQPDQLAGLYVYEQAGDGHTQRGLVGAVALTGPDDGIVLPHENTMAGPVADRLALTEATNANLEPIFLVYDGGGAASAAVAGVDNAEPMVDMTAADGLRHRVWSLTDAEQLAAIAADLRPRRAVIADGHHRYATYLRHQADRHAAGFGSGPWDRGLALLVDATTFGPEVHPIHRVVPNLPPGEAARAAATAFRIDTLDGASPAAALERLDKAAAEGPAFLLAGPNQPFILLTEPDPDEMAGALPAERSAAWRGLHVSVAHELLVRRLWQLTDTETVVGFEHDVPAALAAAERSQGTALLLAATPAQAVLDVAAAGERMPRKSTLFTPKPRSGVLMRAFADEPDAPSQREHADEPR